MPFREKDQLDKYQVQSSSHMPQFYKRLIEKLKAMSKKSMNEMTMVIKIGSGIHA